MTCPTCKDKRWVPRLKHQHWIPAKSLVGCPDCNDNGKRVLYNPDEPLADIVARLPKGHFAREEYKKLIICEREHTKYLLARRGING